MSRPRIEPFIAAVFALVLSLACSSTLPHARGLASAGAAYGKATDALLQVSQETAVDADSSRLLSEAQGLTREERRALLEKHAAVSQTVADLERLRRHARLLTRYFEALGRLAQDDADAQAADATGSAAAALNRLGSELTGSTLLTAAERGLLSQTARLSTGAVRRGAIGRELSARAGAIDQEIRIQQTMLDAVRRKLRADLESSSSLGRERDVARPFIENAVADPRGWIALRRGYLLVPADTDALKSASDAASKLRAAWNAFAAGTFNEAARAGLMADIESVVAYAEAVRVMQR